MTQVGNPEGEDKPNKKVRSHRIQTTGSKEANTHHSTTILVSGFGRAKRRSPPA